jgi:hypothetical protein
LDVAIKRTRKKKESPNYGFLVSWTPGEAHVKRERKNEIEPKLAQISVKKDIVRSLILVSLILTVELVVYLAWSRFIK